jgi:hypothetical protein
MGARPRNHLVVLLLTLSTFNSFADANSWLKPTSGNWEELQWSQGILPNSGHSVMITNAGWKAVQIGSGTAQNFPDSLNVYSITVSSPVDSFNTLLLNYAGFDRPLTVNYSLHVGPGAAMTILSSALRIATPTGVGLSIGGEFNQNDSSQVTGNQADVGWIGPGVYNFNTGLIQLEHLWVGGPHKGVFNQNGGSNAPGILHLETGGTYIIRKGAFNCTTYTADGSVFQQDGGRVHSLLEFHGGQYILNGGFNHGGVRLGVYAGYRKGRANGIQNGGTNYGPIYVGGEYQGTGSYILSNGVVSSPVIDLGMGGGFQQYGGTVTTPAGINLRRGYFDRGGIAGAGFALDAGFLSSPGISVDTSFFRQDGGTNHIAGGLGIYAGFGRGSTMYSLNGGLLTTENTRVIGSPSHQDATGGFVQSGGTHRIANELYIAGRRLYYYNWRGYEMSGGQLIVSNLSLAPLAIFNQTGGTILQSGTATINGGDLVVGPGTQQFGALKLSGTNGLTMPSGSSCVARFRNSSALPWDATTSFTINNWSGSHLGGGAHRIIFGNNAAALTPQQLAKISFSNPAGFAWGVHPAKILPSGEIVPDSLPPTGHNPSRVALHMRPDSRIQITVTGDPGFDYGVLTSYDLANWTFWTNRLATNGTFSVVEQYTVHDSWPYRRFYKSVLMR